MGVTVTYSVPGRVERHAEPWPPGSWASATARAAVEAYLGRSLGLVRNELVQLALTDDVRRVRLPMRPVTLVSVVAWVPPDTRPGSAASAGVGEGMDHVASR